ncbi:hypothetical protein FOL47_007805 [Perkinsus chesapeaki]|uniref:Uncharacterized protein n=1 Tax=Perkinsus chesapeaki TaxID=330153 RepID=A0A7J6LHS6_PERCH|nr:hypothetical protein FOL47_007805 [Perkinsus chesapeaki]
MYKNILAKNMYTWILLIGATTVVRPSRLLHHVSALHPDRVYGVGALGDGKWFKYKSIVPSFAAGILLSAYFARRIDTSKGKISKEGSSCRREHGLNHEHFFAACLQKHFNTNITDGSSFLGCSSCATESLAGKCLQRSRHEELLNKTIFTIMTDSPDECRTAMAAWAMPVSNRTYVFTKNEASIVRAGCPEAKIVQVQDHRFPGWWHKRPYEQRVFVILDWISKQLSQDDIKYIVGFDSDTTWNLQLLPTLLVDIEPNRASVHGYMYKAWDTIYPTGGAGIILTVPAVNALVIAATHGGTCTMANTNFDVMIGRCCDAAAASNVSRIHVDGMWQQPIHSIPLAAAAAAIEAPWGVLTTHKSTYSRLSVHDRHPCQ